MGSIELQTGEVDDGVGPVQKNSCAVMGSAKYFYAKKVDVTSQLLVQKPLSMILQNGTGQSTNRPGS